MVIRFGRIIILIFRSYTQTSFIRPSGLPVPGSLILLNEIVHSHVHNARYTDEEIRARISQLLGFVEVIERKIPMKKGTGHETINNFSKSKKLT